MFSFKTNSITNSTTIATTEVKTIKLLLLFLKSIGKHTTDRSKQANDNIYHKLSLIGKKRSDDIKNKYSKTHAANAI